MADPWVSRGRAESREVRRLAATDSVDELPRGDVSWWWIGTDGRQVLLSQERYRFALPDGPAS
jgi:hypothetical protein